MITLKSLGWNDFFAVQFESYKSISFIPCRISVEHRERYIALSEQGELEAEVSGKFIFTADKPSDFPKTGDWVVGNYFEDENKLIIHDILKRNTKFSRAAAGTKTNEQIIASNIDYLFIMQSIDNNFNPRRLERYLSTAVAGKIKPVIILSKADLFNNYQEKLDEMKETAGSFPVHAISSALNTGIEDIKRYIKEGITIAFTGSSGVGKSTLINLLTGKDVQKIQEVRQADSRGRHTTSRREMFLLDCGGILIDTPGMREFGLWEAQNGLEKVFDQIETLSGDCRFSDCTHTKEAGCAVLSALQAGILSEDRYNSYLKLQKELRYLETKNDINSMLEEKRKWKNINKEQKRLNKRNKF